MELQPQQQQEKDSKTLPDKAEGEGSSSGGGVGRGTSGGDDKVEFSSTQSSTERKGSKERKESSGGGGGGSENRDKKNDGDNTVDSSSSGAPGDPGPSSSTKDNRQSNGKEKESFPSLFISHASINISGSNPDISESERLKNSSGIGGGSSADREKSKTDLDSGSLPQRVVVHRVCSDSRIGEGEGFHSSKLSFYTADGSLTSSLKALGLSINSGKGSRNNSVKKRNGKSKQPAAASSTNPGGQTAGKEAGNANIKNNNNNGGTSSAVATSSGNNKTRSHGTEPKVAGGGDGAEIGEAKESDATGIGSVTTPATATSAKHSTDLLPVIEQSLSESKTEHPSTSEGEETITEDVVDDEEELLDEYDEPNENLDLDFDAAVTELLLRPEKTKYKDSATWTQEDDMPSPLSDFSPVASPRRKKERSNNINRELDRESAGIASGHSHNSLLEQYHQYLLEQQQQHQQPQVHRHSRGGSGSKSGGSGSHHHSHSQHSHHNPKSSIVGIHQGNLKSHSHSHHPQIPLPPPPPPQQAECFTVSSQLLSREAKLYENVPATQGELETLEILLASGGSGDSNYPPSGGSGSGGGASNTTASTSNTSGTSGQSHTQSHHKTSSHGGANNNGSNNGNHRSTHHHHQQQKQQPHQHHHHYHSSNHHLLHEDYVHGQHSHSATNLNTTNAANSSEQLFSVSDFLGPGGGLSVGNNNGGPPSRTSWADSGRESLSFDGENNNSTGSTRNLLLIPPPPPPPINYLASTSSAAVGHSTFGNSHGSSSMMHPSHHTQQHHGAGGGSKHSSHHHHHTSHHHSHHHHSHSQVQSSDSPSHHQTHNSKRSRRERLVRQKHAVNDETLYPQGGADKNSGMGIGDNSGFMVVPSPRRGILSGSMQASNFVAAAASPINLQRHPPASQIMLQENKKNGPLIPCESPYGIMAGGAGPVGTGEWSYPETFGDNFRRPTNKSHLTSNLLRSRSPQRGIRGMGGIDESGGGGRSRKGNNNSSFDYGELPSHQMFPKRHLLTSRQFSGHRGYSPGTSGTMQNNNGTSGLCPPTGFQPMQHRSFPVGVFSGNTPRSCSMGDLTSSGQSLNGIPGQGHHHSNHQNGKTPEGLAISSNTAPVHGMQPSTVPLVTSLPLPPATSVTYEFSLAPVSGTLAPGWHLTAVQRGLATAVPLAAAVARRRLPRPRTTRPRFGFTDKNEARRAKWTIVITALALLAMSMLLVGVTLRLAPLIDDLGSSSSGSFKNRIAFRRDPLSRRASGDAAAACEASSSSYCGINPLRAKNKLLLGPDCSGAGMDNGHNNLGQNEFNSLHSSVAGSGQNLSFTLAPQPLEMKMCALLASRNQQDSELDNIRRQTSMTLSIPSRDNSVRSHTSSKSYGSYSGPVPLASVSSNIPTSGSIKLAAGQAQPVTGKLVRYGSNPDIFPSRRSTWKQDQDQEILYDSGSRTKQKGSKNLVTGFEQTKSGSSSNITPSSSRSKEQKKRSERKQKRNEKVAWAVHLGFSSLLILAITCIVVFLRLSSDISNSADESGTASNGSLAVRKENENLLQSIQPKLNLTTPQPSTHTQVQDNSIGIEDNGNDNSGKSIGSLQGGQSLTRTNPLTSSDNALDGDMEEEDDQQKSNNDTSHENENISKGGGGEDEGGPSRSNNNNIIINRDMDNPSLKVNSSRPKRSRPKSLVDESVQNTRSSNIISSVLNGKVHVNVRNNTPPGLTKTRHLESTLIRFFKNSGGHGVRERRNLEGRSRKL